MLKIQDKSYAISLFLIFSSHSPPQFTSDRMEEVVEHVARAIDSAAGTPDFEIIWGVLHILRQLKKHPWGLVDQAYRWCLMIWRNRDSYEDWETLALLSLEVGFHHHCISLDSRAYFPYMDGQLHQGVYRTVLESNNAEAVTALVWASLMFDRTGELGLRICADYIIDHRGRITEPSSRHLRSFFTNHVVRMGSYAVKKVGKERSVQVLNGLHIGIEKAGHRERGSWSEILVEVIRFAKARCLALHSWKFLAEFATEGRRLHFVTYDPDITISLTNAQEWDKLECWVGIVWMECPPEPDSVAKDLEDAMEVLAKERPGALRKRVERWSGEHRRNLPASFQLTCDKLAL